MAGVSEPAKRRRVPAMAPEERRAALIAVVDLLRWRLSANEPLVAAIRKMAGDPAAGQEFLERMQETRRAMLAGIAAVIEPDAALLRRDPRSAARLLLMMVMASVHNGFGDRTALGGLSSAEVVSLVLDGLLVRTPDETAPTGGSR